MKICDINKIVNTNFNGTFINALQQFWHTTKTFQCIGAPKKQNLLLYLNGCKITYTDKNNNFFVANSGDVVYTPIGSEYKAQLSDFESSTSHTIGVNFFLLDDVGENIILSNDILIFKGLDSKILPLLFQKTLNYNATQPFIKNRIALMEILSCLCTGDLLTPNSKYVNNALEYLSKHVEENPSVAKLAKLNNVSEVYFRKQFKAQIGVSPLEYRNSLRLARAKSYLEYGDISIQEISDALGYATVSHFIKEFKKRYGCSPLQYRKLNKMN